MDTQKTAAPEDVYRMPWERGEATPVSESTAYGKLQGMLAGSEEPTGPTKGEDEPVPADAGDAEDEEDVTPAEEEAEDADESEEQSEDDEEQDSEEDEEEDQLPATVKVKVDGEEVEVTLDEALKGYSRTADYTRKTQALATDRKTFEAEQQAVRAEREAYKQRLELLDQALAESTPQEPDWDRLYATNRTEYAAQRARFEEIRQRRLAVAQEHQRVTLQQQRDAERQKEALVAEEGRKLLEAIPEWKDEAKAKRGKSELVEYATGLGFTEEQLDAITDHRVIVMLHKAMKLDRMNAKGAKVVDKVVAKKGKILKPGSTTASPKKANRGKVQKTRATLARSGDPKVAAALLEAMGLVD